MPWKTITDLLADRLLRIYTTFSALLGVNWTYAVPLRSPPSANLMNTFLPLELAPSVMGNAVGEPELPAEERVTVTMPLMASSIKSQLVFVVSPHVPDCSPEPIFSIPKKSVYVLAIILHLRCYFFPIWCLGRANC